MRALAELRTGEGVLVLANGAFQLHRDGSVLQDPLALIRKATVRLQETDTITLKAGDTAEPGAPLPVPGGEHQWLTKSAGEFQMWEGDLAFCPHCLWDKDKPHLPFHLW